MFWNTNVPCAEMIWNHLLPSVPSNRLQNHKEVGTLIKNFLNQNANESFYMRTLYPESLNEKFCPTCFLEVWWVADEFMLNTCCLLRSVICADYGPLTKKWKRVWRCKRRESTDSKMCPCAGTFLLNETLIYCRSSNKEQNKGIKPDSLSCYPTCGRQPILLDNLTTTLWDASRWLHSKNN